MGMPCQPPPSSFDVRKHRFRFTAFEFRDDAQILRLMRRLCRITTAYSLPRRSEIETTVKLLRRARQEWLEQNRRNSQLFCSRVKDTQRRNSICLHQCPRLILFHQQIGWIDDVHPDQVKRLVVLTRLNMLLYLRTTIAESSAFRGIVDGTGCPAVPSNTPLYLVAINVATRLNKLPSLFASPALYDAVNRCQLNSPSPGNGHSRKK